MVRGLDPARSSTPPEGLVASGAPGPLGDDTAGSPGGLELQVLGELRLLRDGAPRDLPPSKKTRALLSYLAITEKPHRRERLCSLLWDVTDDPRGALRWSLSKLRALVDDPGVRRVIADREMVQFEPNGARVDWCSLRGRIRNGLGDCSFEELSELEATFRGELLEGLDLPDFHDFQAWCIAEREDARRAHGLVLRTLVERSEDAARALGYLRTLVRIDPLDAESRARLVSSLAHAGHGAEARLHLEAAEKLFRELGQGASYELVRAAGTSSQAPPAEPPSTGSAEHDWNRFQIPPGAAQAEPAELEEAELEGIVPSARGDIRLVGRDPERAHLLRHLDQAFSERKARLLLVLGEPGIGKTRLLAELRQEALARSASVFDGRSYEAELARPYAPWIDALQRLPGHALGDVLGPELSPLLPELGGREPTGGATSRDRLFGAVADLIAARAHGAPVVILLDDLQWCDGASAELLHYVVRMNVHRPVLFVLAARGGELPDNQAVERVLRSLRRTRGFDELQLEPLDSTATAELLQSVGSRVPPEHVYARCAGNPLFAIELCRARHEADGSLPRTLQELIRDRVARLPADAADLLRWCAVLGPTVQVSRLHRMLATDTESLIRAIERLEQHGMLRASSHGRRPGGSYEFTHDVVRQAVYGELSEPRRQLMHLKVAEALAENEAEDDAAVLDLVHHAALAGEPARGAEACVRAGRRCVRLFANREAVHLARRGMRLAEELSPVERVQRTLELYQVELAARRPADLADTARRLEELAQEALELDCLEHARLGYHLASYLRWEQGDWSDAQRVMLQAERVSRGSNEGERVMALAEAARCLTLLERDLPHAEALLLEADARATRAGLELVAIPDAVGLLRWHQGRWPEAMKLFDEARRLARQTGDRDGEFRALEHRLLVELERGSLAEAAESSRELLRLGERLREGSELPFAQVLAHLVRFALGEADAETHIELAFEALRHADAKHRLVHALTRAADLDLAAGRFERARQRALEALAIAERLERPTEAALACICLAECCRQLGDDDGAGRYSQRAAGLPHSSLSARARAALDAMSHPQEPPHAG